MKQCSLERDIFGISYFAGSDIYAYGKSSFCFNNRHSLFVLMDARKYDLLYNAVNLQGFSRCKNTRMVGYP